jgi:HEAT repeat protein
VWKRWLVGIALVLACSLVAAWLFPAMVYVPMGSVRREAFFDGKPTNYWVRALKQEGFLGHAPPPGDAGKALREGGGAAVPVLREMASSPDDDVRAETLRVLTYLGPEARPATPELAAAMKAEDNSNRFILASEALAKADPVAAGETLGAVLRDKTNNSRRSWALTQLLELAPQGQEALPALKDISSDPKEDALLRIQAIRMMGRLHEPAEPLLAVLVEFVTTPKSPAGVQAVEALGEMGPAAKPALPTLLKLLDDRSVPLTGQRWGPLHKAAVIHTVGEIGPDAREAVPRLLAFLKTKDYFVRLHVAIALANMGPSVKEALAARDAATCATIVFMPVPPASKLATPVLVKIAVRTWIPWQERNAEDIREALNRVDPDVTPRLGGGGGGR